MTELIIVIPGFVVLESVEWRDSDPRVIGERKATCRRTAEETVSTRISEPNLTVPTRPR
jgi:hypothetical protein